MRKLAVVALSATLIAPTPVIAASMEGGAGGSCGYSQDSFGLNVIDLDHPMEFVMVGDVGLKRAYYRATGLQPGDKVIITLGQDQDWLIGVSPGARGSTLVGSLTFGGEESSNHVFGGAGVNERAEQTRQGGQAYRQSTVGPTGLYYFSITRGGVEVGEFTCAVLGKDDA